MSSDERVNTREKEDPATAAETAVDIADVEASIHVAEEEVGGVAVVDKKKTAESREEAAPSSSAAAEDGNAAPLDVSLAQDISTREQSSGGAARRRSSSHAAPTTTSGSFEYSDQSEGESSPREEGAAANTAGTSPSTGAASPNAGESGAAGAAEEGRNRAPLTTRPSPYSYEAREVAAFEEGGGEAAPAAAPATYAEFVNSEPVMGIPVGQAPPPAQEPEQHEDNASYAAYIAPDGSVVIRRFPAGAGMPEGTTAMDAAGAAAAMAEPYDEELLTFAWQMRRTVRMWSVMETILVCIWMMVRLWFAAFLVFPILGLFGASRVNPSIMTIYLCYFPIIIPLRLYAAYLKSEDSDSSSSEDGLWWAFSAVAVALEIALALQAWRARTVFKQLSMDEAGMIMSGWQPPNRR